MLKISRVPNRPIASLNASTQKIRIDFVILIPPGKPWFIVNGGDTHLVHQRPNMFSAYFFTNPRNGYGFNTPSMKKFHRNILHKRIPGSCKYCQRRFMGKEFGAFSHKENKWILQKPSGLDF